jgi:hypothetical protein
MKRIRTSILLAVALLSTACSRGVTVGSAAPGASYAVSVTNSTASAMDVSYNDGSEHMLGNVAAGKTDRFVVAGSRQSTVSISGRSAAGRTSGPYQISLAAGSTAAVTLR